MTTRFTTRALLALAAALLLWASAFAGIRAGLRAYSPGQLAVLRFGVASIVLAVYASVAHFRRPKGRDIPGFLLSGIIGITFYNLALNYGETRVTAGAASLLIASTPIWTALLASFTLHERLTPRRWMGILVSFAGVALIASGEGQGIHLSPQALIILAAALTSAIYMVQQKHFLGRYSALEFTAYSIWSGTLFMLPFGGGLLHTMSTAPAWRNAGCDLSGNLSRGSRLCGLGICDVTRPGWTYDFAALSDSCACHCHCMGMAGRGAESAVAGGWGDRAAGSGAGQCESKGSHRGLMARSE